MVNWDIGIYTDASKHGLGGYNPTTGIGWRYELPSRLAQQLHINVKEFIATLIGVWLEINSTKINYASILCLTDNNSAVTLIPTSNPNTTMWPEN